MAPSSKQTGLTATEAAKKLAQYGPNILPHKQSEPWWKKLLREFSDLMVIILMLAALIAFFLGERIDGSIILVVVILNACIGFFQEWKSEKTLEALQKMVSPEAIVIRDGKEQKINAEQLVPGDIVKIREGDRIPADGIIIDNFDLKVSEAALTGESVAVLKEVDQEVSLGTAAVYGSALMRVVSTGAETAFGNIAKLTLSTKTQPSPLQKELFRVGVFVGKLTGILVVGVFILDFFVKKVPFVESLLFSISVAVAAVPEGLPATITIALALGVQRLAQKKAIVKQLSSAETLGATTVICSDKTGTITRNEMTVTRGLLATGNAVSFAGIGWNPAGAVTAENTEDLSSIQTLLNIAQNCNDAKLEYSKESDTPSILGDPTEGALLIAAEKFSQNFPEHAVATMPVEKTFPFDARRKMMSTLHQDDAGNGQVFVKGAPEMLLPQCAFFWNGHEAVSMTAEKRKEFLEKVAQLSSKALRVLAFATREYAVAEMPTTVADAEQKLVFHGLLGMIDLPRQAVPEAVQAAHTAGIRTIIITGDNPETATAIAREVGIITRDDAIILIGEELQQLNDEQLTAHLFAPSSAESAPYKEILFARTAPEDKMRIVSLLQARGEIVAVTGDGVNDAPALKKANIGVTMGITGTEVSKEAAHMILLDDSFATIVSAITEGRKIFSNLRKFLLYLFSGNIGELVVIITTLLIAVPAPLTAVLILLVNLGTDVLPAIALSFERAEAEIMRRPPRDPEAHILDKKFILYFTWRGMILGATVLAAFLWILFANGWTWAATLSTELHHKGMSVAFATLVISQMFLALSARHFHHSAFFDFFGNKVLLGAIALSLAFVGCVLFIPFANQILQTSPLSLFELSMVVLFASGVLWAEELRKLLGKRRREVLG